MTDYYITMPYVDENFALKFTSEDLVTLTTVFSITLTVFCFVWKYMNDLEDPEDDIFAITHHNIDIAKINTLIKLVNAPKQRLSKLVAKKRIRFLATQKSRRRNFVTLETETESSDDDSDSTYVPSDADDTD